MTSDPMNGWRFAILIALVLCLFIVLLGAEMRYSAQLETERDRIQAECVEAHWRTVLPGTCDEGCP